MAVAGIFHTGITVSDLDRSIAFYRDDLGLELVTRWESSQPYLRTVVGFPDAELRIALLRVPAMATGVSGHHIELLEYRTPRGQRGDARTCNPGNAHVAFVVEDLDRVYADLSARGVRFSCTTMPRRIAAETISRTASTSSASGAPTALISAPASPGPATSAPEVASAFFACASTRRSRVTTCVSTICAALPAVV